MLWLLPELYFLFCEVSAVIRYVMASMILSVGLSACVSNNSRTAESVASSEEAPEAKVTAEPFLGCYVTNTVREEKPAPKTMASLFVKTDNVCILSTPQSRSGNFAFEMRTNNKLINTIGNNLSSDKPKCPDCYSFSGLMGNIEMSATPKTASVELKITFTHDKSVLLVAMEKIDTAAAPLACSKMLDEANKHKVTMTMSPDRKRLTVEQESLTGDFAPETFALAQVQLAAEPTAAVTHECTEGTRVMKLWPTYFRFDSMYFRVKKI